nr:hypothetical protein [Tanacetum cinerariifolium]
KQPLRATTPIEPTDLQRTKVAQLKIALKRSRQETHISQQSGSGTGEGTGSKPGVSDVPSDDSEEELSWKSSDDSDDGSDKDSDETVKSGAGKDGDVDDDEDDDDDDEEEEHAKDDKENKETGKGGEEVRKSRGESEEEKETSEEDEGSFDPIPRTLEDSENETDDEEEQESKLSEEVRIQEEEDAEELYREAPIPPPTIPSIILENLLTFNSAFHFEERLRLLETSFYEYRQTNQFADAVSAIPSIIHQYMDQQMKEAVREAIQIQTDRLQDSVQRENDELQVSRILPRIEESVNATLEAEVLTRSSHSSRTSYAVASDLSEMELKKILIEKMEGNKS